MDSQTDKTLRQHIDTLINVISIIIKDAIQKRKVGFELEPFQFKEIDGFSYGNKGATFAGATHKSGHKKNWMRSSFFIGDIVFKTREFNLAESFISENYTNPNAKAWFQQYVFQIFNFFFENSETPDLAAIENHKNKYIRDIKSEPHPAKAQVYINGLILESQTLKIDDETILRQTIKTDLETPKNSYDEYPFLPIPSAVLDITMQLKRDEHGKLQERIEKYITLFRLFKVGSINYNSYDMKFDTVASPFAQMSMPHNINHAWKQYYIAKSDEAKFLDFLYNLPLSAELFSFRRKVNYVTTAYDRYCEALLEKGAIERKVANAIMGIEALLSNDNQELAFKMQTRTSKLISNFGFEPITVRTHINKAYGIRSKFAHGGYLTDKNKAELEKVVGNIDVFATSVIDYLRILIIVSMALRINKDSLLSLIDDALIDDSKALDLRKVIEPIHKFIT